MTGVVKGARLAKWGNSLALRIPSHVAQALEMTDGQAVELRVDRGTLTVVKSQRAPVYTLEELVAGVSEDNRHPELDWGPPRGAETL